MEGIREIATAYYERSNDQEKELAEEFFRKLDANRDGKVSLTELKKSVGSLISNEKIFQLFDENGDRTLDFSEVLAVYYMVNKVEMLICRGCWGLLVGPYFSCLLCFGKRSDTFNLCCSCYRQGNVSHEHSDKYLLDHHSLLSELRKRCSETGKEQGKIEMEELRQIAKAHYRAGSPEVQALAYDFFRTMDTDGDGRVDLSEFLAFMRQQGYLQMRNPSFFIILDRDGNGTLDFSEVMTLYYIIKSGRPFCDSCGNFIPGIFFSCVECFKNPEKSFNLCRDCYRSTKCKHNHDGRAQFLDNYTLLEAKRAPSLAHATGLHSDQTRPNTWNGNFQVPQSNVCINDSLSLQTRPNAWNGNFRVPQSNVYMNTTYPTYSNVTYPTCPPSPSPNYSNAIVPAGSTRDKWKAALRAFEIALSIGNISSTMCTIL